jgi:8-oxo-dGTP diphosphatase
MTTTSPQAPAGYNPTDYPAFAVTVDLAVFTIRNGALCVLLVERAEEPYAGAWALPGGFVDIAEDTETAAWRELAEETGVERFATRSGGHLEQLKTYSAPDRDPRMRVVSVAHVAIAPHLPSPVAGSDARNARWWAVAEVLDDEGPALAFDHAEILEDALERVRSKIEYTTLATEFAEEPFTLPELHRVYSAIWGFEPDLGNFRRKVLKTTGFVEATADKGSADSAGGRRPLLYRRGSAVVLQPPMTRARRDDE